MADGMHGDASWLEPSAGEGVFAQEARRVTEAEVVAVDIAPRTRRAVEGIRFVDGVDFFEWVRSPHKQFDCIVGNPPYVRLRELPVHLRQTALRAPGIAGVELGETANYWCAFVRTALCLLRAGGAVGLVLPAAYEYADYAAPLRAAIQRLFASVRIVRSRVPLFDDVSDGSVVLLARGFGLPCADFARVVVGNARDAVTAIGDVWKLDAAQSSHDARLRFPGGSQHLVDVVRVRLGAVAGDASYFVLCERDRAEAGLPSGALRPIVARSRHIQTSDVTAAYWRALRDSGERVWMFSPPPALLGHAAVRRYLEGAGENVKGRAKVLQRVPWYRPRLPPRPHGFISGMTNSGPWLAMSGWTRLSATNTLYTVRFEPTLTASQRDAFAIALVHPVVREQIRALTRVYPDGLRKIEPGRLHGLVLPRLTRPAPEGLRQLITAEFVAGNVSRAENLAFKFFRVS